MGNNDQTQPRQTNTDHAAGEFVGVVVCSEPFHLLPIEPAHLLTLAQFPYHHNDPFDRLLAAQAIAENMPMVSIDEALDAYGVQRIW